MSQRAGKEGIGYSHCPCFWNAINKYGFINFNCTILMDDLTQEQAELMEKYYIRKFKTQNRKYGYNISEGGHYNPSINKPTLYKYLSMEVLGNIYYLMDLNYED